MPFCVKKRFSESQSEVKSPGSSAQSQSSAWRMLSSRSVGKKNVFTKSYIYYITYLKYVMFYVFNGITFFTIHPVSFW